VDKLISIGLKKVCWIGRCEADKIAQGIHEVSLNEGGNYALVLDNTFSKNLSKTATFFLLTYPTAHPPQFGATLHHSQAATNTAPPTNSSKFSPALRPRKESVGSVSNSSPRRAILATNLAVPPGGANPVVPTSSTVHAGVLQKRRRKRHQGYARRFFSLDFTSSTLSYYHDRSSSALRGAVPLSLAAIGANAATREISIDSGAEVWHLKAVTQGDFEVWKKALEKASKNLADVISPGGPLKIQPSDPGTGTGNLWEDREWERVEGLVGRIAGTTDSVRRLCVQTDPKNFHTSLLGPESGASTPTEANGDDYFKQDDRRPFWKRKPSANNAPTSIFRRTASSQLAAPPSSAEPPPHGSAARTPSPMRSLAGHHHHHEESMHEHCQAMLHDLDSVLAEFSALIAESKQRRVPALRSAVSRLSVDSTGSQEYFDAEDKSDSPFLIIRSDSNDGRQRDQERTVTDADSVSSSDIDDEVDHFSGPAKAVRFDSIASAFPSRSKSLAPLPLSAVRRRTNVPPPTIMPPSLIGFLRKNVGKDLSTISMPVSANEPISLLQRAAEQLEYSELLDSAASATDGVERLIYVTAFAIASLSSVRAKERSIRKPFNPMLGETFELIREDKGFRFVSEKVSHRPVQLALYAESNDWAFTHSPLPSQKFWGKSSELLTDGKARVHLHPSGETLSWSSATSFLRNILAGEKYVEPVGVMAVVNETTGQKAVVTFKVKGMFAGRSEELTAQTFDTHGQELPLGLNGTWVSSVQLTEHGTVTKKTIWSAGSLVDQASKHYGLTSFAAALNEVTDIERGKLPPTDSRLRADQILLEQGNHDEAEEVKTQLEERQRARRKEMEYKGEEWRPRWFTRLEIGEEVVWKLKTGKDGYWEERAKGKWTDVVPVLKL
jgi:oxysterol-binding protein-related protein 3/6/7